MTFEKTMSKHLDDVREELNKLTLDFPELMPHFSLGHSGLFDNETEKLVEAFCYMLTASEATRKSAIANKLKPFMESIFPEWYRPEVASAVVEFDNYNEFEELSSLLENKEPITFESHVNGNSFYLSARGGVYLTSYKIEKSYFTLSDSFLYLNLVFKNQLDIKDINSSKKIKVYLNSHNIEEVIALFYYIFDPDFKDEKIILISDNEKIELNRSVISLSIFDNIKENNKIFFNVKNKIFILTELLNNINHFFYIDIDLSSNLDIDYNDFSILIPIDKKYSRKTLHMKDFAITNCFPVFDVYKDTLESIDLSEYSKNKIYVGDLKNNNIISIIEKKYLCYHTKRDIDKPEGVVFNSEIQFTNSIPFNLINTISVTHEKLKKPVIFTCQAVLSYFINKTRDIKQDEKYLIELNGLRFGSIITEITDPIYYSEILNDSNFFNKIYNINFFIGKKIDNISMIKDYVSELKKFYFRFKNIFFNYIENFEILKWEVVAKFENDKNPKLISRYKVKKTDNDSTYFYDRLFEKILAQISEIDLVYEIIRI